VKLFDKKREKRYGVKIPFVRGQKSSTNPITMVYSIANNFIFPDKPQNADDFNYFLTNLF